MKPIADLLLALRMSTKIEESEALCFHDFQNWPEDLHNEGSFFSGACSGPMLVLFAFIESADSDRLGNSVQVAGKSHWI